MATPNVVVDNDEQDSSFYDQMFERYVNPVLADGSASLKTEELKVPEKTSPNGKELTGSWEEFAISDISAALGYAKSSLATKEKPDVDDTAAMTQVLSWIERAINTTRKANARAKLINDAVPPEDKLALQFAKKLVAAGKFAELDVAIAHVKNTVLANL